MVDVTLPALLVATSLVGGVVAVAASARTRLSVAWTRGQSALQDGRFEDAEKAFTRSLALAERLFGAQHWRTALHLNALAVALLEQKRAADAAPLVARAVAIVDGLSPLPHPDVAAVWAGAALHCEAVGDHDGAIEYAEKARAAGGHSARRLRVLAAVASRAQAKKGDHAGAVRTLMNAPAGALRNQRMAKGAHALVSAGDLPGAVEAFAAVVALEAPGWPRAFFRSLRAQALAAGGRTAEAKAEAAAALREMEAIVPGQIALVDPLLVLARAARAAGDAAAAQDACTRVLSLVDAVDGGQPYRAAPGDDVLARAAAEARALLA